MSLVCLGALSAERLLHLLEDTPFGISKPGARTRQPAAYVPAVPSKQEQVIHLSQFSQLAPAQTTCTIEWVIPLHVRRYQVFLLTDLLEELLTEQWRYQRSLTYDVSVRSEYYQDCRALTLHSELPPDRLALAQDLLWQTLGSIPQALQRFVQVKQQRIASLSRMDYSGYDVLTAVLVDLAGYHRLIPFTEELHQLEQVQFAEIVELAAFLTPERHFCFISCP
jgi:hypothetical protein